MCTIKMVLLAAAVVVGIPAASTLAAQQFGRDGVTVQPSQSARSVPTVVEVTRSGRDSVFVTKDAVITRPDPTRYSDGVF